MRDLIKELAKDLPLNSSLRTFCPFCGAEDERSFSLTRAVSGILYHCYRASCQKQGIVGSIARPYDDPERRKQKFKCYKGALTSEIPEDVYSTIFQPYGITKQEIRRQGIRFAPGGCWEGDKGRVYFPIYDYRNFQIGENLRSIHAEQTPKTIVYRWGEIPIIHFPTGQQLSDNLVLVEDQTSSIKVGLLSFAAAILGTNLTEDCLSLFQRIGIKKIILMMDGDKAGRIATVKLLNLLQPFFKVDAVYLPLGKDPKHLSIEALQEVLSEY